MGESKGQWISTADGARLRVSRIVINKQQFDENFSGMKTRYTSVFLKTYSGEEISPIGILDVDVEYNGKQQNLPLFVVMNGRPALFGARGLIRSS